MSKLDISINDAEYGNTAKYTYPINQNAMAVVLNASGSEFRVVFSTDRDETRATHKTCIVFVVGQNNNQVSTIGMGNPFFSNVRRVSGPQAQTTLNLGTDKVFWFGIDQTSRWAAMGVGNQPGRNTILCARFLEYTIPFRFISFSNWKDPVHLSISSVTSLNMPFGASNKFDYRGQFIRFEGVTTICFVDPVSEFFRAVSTIQQMIVSNPVLAPHFAILPPSSFHMTTMDLFSREAADADRTRDDWEAFLDQVRAKFMSTVPTLTSATMKPVAIDGSLTTIVMKPVGDTVDNLKNGDRL